MNDPFEEAQGWIELGSYAEAAEILNNLPPKLKSTVEFVRSWILIYAGTEAWTNVELMCETLLATLPGDEFGVFHKAEAIHRQGKTADAVIYLGETEYGRKTPDGLYNLARYLCANDQRHDAFTILGMAIEKDKSLKKKALFDPELDKLWIKLQGG